MLRSPPSIPAMLLLERLAYLPSICHCLATTCLFPFLSLSSPNQFSFACLLSRESATVGNRSLYGENAATTLTMPLDEPLVPPTRRKGSIEQRQREAYPENPPNAAGYIYTDSPSFVQNASAVQSMLRNTTEIGNVGPFSQKQQLVPSPNPGSVSKLSLRPRVASKNFPQSSAYDPRGPHSNNGHHMPKVSRQGEDSFNL